MLKNSIIAVGMDIGTTHIRVIIGEFNKDGTINIVGVGTNPSPGFKKGFITDLDGTVSAVREAVREAERMAGLKVSSVFLGIVDSQVSVINNRGVVAVSDDDKEITEEDVERAMQLARVINLPSEKEIIDVLPREFIVDGCNGIRDPVGMFGVRLEVNAMVVSSASSSTRNLLRCVKRAGLEINGLVINSLANAAILLSQDEKELGVLLLDIGGGKAEISIFREGTLKDISMIPIGGSNITYDLAIGLQTTIEQAEKLKVNYGVASLKLPSTDKNITVLNVAGKGNRTKTQADLARIIEPRILEILQLMKEKARKMGCLEPLPAGVVLTGGVSLMEGIEELTEEVFNCSARTAKPEHIGVKSPLYSTAVGIIHYVQRNHMVTAPKDSPTTAVKDFVSHIRHWFMTFFE